MDNILIFHGTNSKKIINNNITVRLRINGAGEKHFIIIIITTSAKIPRERVLPRPDSARHVTPA